MVRPTLHGANGRGFGPSRGYAARFRVSQPGDYTSPPAVRRLAPRWAAKTSNLGDQG